MPTEPRHFHLSDILTITTGRLVASRGVEGVYDILNYMTGSNLYTHEFPGAMKLCRDPLFAQHPQLAGDAVAQTLITPPADGDKEGWAAWVAGHVARFGETLPVTPLDPTDES